MTTRQRATLGTLAALTIHASVQNPSRTQWFSAAEVADTDSSSAARGTAIVLGTLKRSGLVDVHPRPWGHTYAITLAGLREVLS
jgi:hypothetical protein